MGLPSKRRTSRSKRERAAHFALGKLPIQFDEDGNPKLPHRASPISGKYRGKTGFNVEKRVRRATKRLTKATRKTA